MAEKTDRRIPGPHLIEKWGTSYFRRLSGSAKDIPLQSDVHVLTDEERREIRGLERGAILRAAAAGAISAIISGWASFIAYKHLDDPNADLLEEVEYLSFVIGVTLLATALEIGYLYMDALRTVHNISQAAGLNLFPKGTEDTAVVNALVRAALELPNPSDKDIYVNPRKETPGYVVIFSTLVYKAKVTLSNFLLKALARRLLGRVVARAYMEFVAVPVTAVWNAVVCWWVIREARIRAMGPSAITEMVRFALPESLHLSPAGALAVRRAVGASIVRTSDLHPNLHFLLLSVRHRVGDEEAVVDDSALFLRTLGSLSEEEQKVALKVLGIAMAIDGKLARREKKLWEESHEVCNREAHWHSVKELLRNFRSGKHIDSDLIQALPGEKHAA